MATQRRGTCPRIWRRTDQIWQVPDCWVRTYEHVTSIPWPQAGLSAAPRKIKNKGLEP
jgi:hypothetical protein